MGEIKDALRFLEVARLDVNSAIEKFKTAEDAAFEVFNLITSAEYGKQRFFKEESGLIFDREKREYLRDFETALNRYLEEIGYAD